MGQKIDLSNTLPDLHIIAQLQYSHMKPYNSSEIQKNLKPNMPVCSNTRTCPQQNGLNGNKPKPLCTMLPTWKPNCY